MWLICCIIMTTAYRSSLVAHLTVQGKTPAINSFHDLLKHDGWSWGTTNRGGSFNAYMEASTDPVVRKLAANMEVYSKVI